ncbi:MAG: hypothetical protein HC902_01065 [Calothrix sp. SM1_5_4]|nr:hypothetical protein [Calothrix sp. SM1_5_4]
MKLAEATSFDYWDNISGVFEFPGKLFPSHLRVSRGFREYVAAHERLGELALAPRLLAIIELDELRDLAARPETGMQLLMDQAKFDTNLLSTTPYIGLVMEEIPFAHPLSRNVPPEAFGVVMADWCEAQVDQALREIVEIRRRTILSGIHLFDQQLVVDRDAHAHLIDVDGYRFDPRKATDTKVNAEMETLVQRWQTASGRVFPRPLLERRLSEASIAYVPCSEPMIAGEWRVFAGDICRDERQTAEAPVLQVWPNLVQSYERASFVQKAVAVGGAGAAVWALTTVANPPQVKLLTILVGLILPTNVNSNEAEGYYRTPMGVEELMHAPLDQVNRVLSQPRNAEFYWRLYQQSSH